MALAKTNKNPLIKPKKRINKPALCTPFKTKWTTIQPQKEEQILAILKKAFNSVDLKPPQIDQSTTKEHRNKLQKEARDAKTEQEKNLMKQLVCGAGAVTRAAERQQLRLCLVDLSSPWQLHKHLIQVCAVRGCVAGAVRALSSVVAPALGLTRCAVLGFKKMQSGDDDYFTAHIDEMLPLIPASKTLPWLHPLDDGEKEEEELEEQIKLDACIENVVTCNGNNLTEDNLVPDNSTNKIVGNNDDMTKDNLVSDSDSDSETCDRNNKKDAVKDYSHLYIYKKDLAVKKPGGDFGENFISISSADDVSVYQCQGQTKVDALENNSMKKPLKQKTKLKQAKKRKRYEYEPVNVGRMVAQEDKKAKKKRKKVT